VCWRARRGRKWHRQHSQGHTHVRERGTLLSFSLTGVISLAWHTRAEHGPCLLVLEHVLPACVLAACVLWLKTCFPRMRCPWCPCPLPCCGYMTFRRAQCAPHAQQARGQSLWVESFLHCSCVKLMTGPQHLEQLHKAPSHAQRVLLPA